MKVYPETRLFGPGCIPIPALGIGCSPFGNRQQKLPDQAVEEAVAAAFAADAAYFDVAPYYGFGLAEKRLGRALSDYDRSSFLVSTKVGRCLDPDPNADTTKLRYGFLSDEPFSTAFDYSFDGIMRSFESSLIRMGLEMIDIVFVHDIGTYAHKDQHELYFRQFLDGGYRALSELKAAGRIKAIGLGVNETEVCEQVMAHADMDGFLLAGRYTLLEQGGVDALIPKCATKRVSLIIGAPYNSGLLAGGTRRDGVLRYEYGVAPEHIVQKLKQLEAVCDEFQVPIAAAALQFPLSEPVVACVIPGLSNGARVRQTVELLAYPIPVAFWSKLRSLDLIDERAKVPGDHS